MGKGIGMRMTTRNGAKAQTHLPKELEGRKYYRPKGSSSPADDEEDLNSPW